MFREGGRKRDTLTRLRFLWVSIDFPPTHSNWLYIYAVGSKIWWQPCLRLCEFPTWHINMLSSSMIFYVSFMILQLHYYLLRCIHNVVFANKYSLKVLRKPSYFFYICICFIIYKAMKYFPAQILFYPKINCRNQPLSFSFAFELINRTFCGVCTYDVRINLDQSLWHEVRIHRV